MPDSGLLSQNVPRSTSRRGRVAMLAELARALLDDKLPSHEARIWFGSGLSAWLESGTGSLDQYLRITAPRGSHHRPQVLARKLLMSDERQVNDETLKSGRVNNKDPNEL